TVSAGTPTASNGNKTFTYSLSGLTVSTGYATCVTTGAKDVAGNALASSYTATWTTGVGGQNFAIQDGGFEAGTDGVQPTGWTGVVGATVSSAEARTGTKSLLFTSNPGGNSTAFDIPNSLKNVRGGNTKFVFWIKGTADKALVFTFNGTNTGQRRCGPITTSDVTASNSSAYGGPTGEINTAGAWRKCTIDLTSIITDFDAANPIRLRVGSSGNYNVYLDDFEFEP
ncbi:MAG TPA: hypothetical protein PLY93_04310, partial [Turneriella sp.]|nr:hypothetical protein [Turneriella sp.]